MHIRKAKKFTDAEINYLASFPLVTFEKTTGFKAFQSTEEGTLAAAKAVKKVNPSAKILYYRNVIVHYGTYMANSEIEKMPGAFLTGSNEKTKMIRNTLRAYDLSNRQVWDWWVGLAAGGPAFDVFGWLVHRSAPFWLQLSLGLPAPDPGKLSPA